MRSEAAELTYLMAAEAVLRLAGRPLSAREIVDRALADGLLPNATTAKTPQKSMQARLSMHILRAAGQSTFVRTSAGRFQLRATLEASDRPPIESFDRNMHRERVLCIPREHYEKFLGFQGIEQNASTLLDELLKSDKITYLPRAIAENDPNFKQVVTYTILQHRDEFLSFRRGQFSRVASFLKGARCIGFGGHVIEGDADIFGHSDRGVRACAAREIKEELRLELGRLDIKPEDLGLMGLLNDDSSEVGRKHLAVVFKYVVTNRQSWNAVREGETSVRNLKWTSIDSTDIDLNDYEYWSQLYIRKFHPQLASQQSGVRVLNQIDATNRHLLVVVGTIGSGKSYTASVLKDHCKYSVVNTGRLVAALIGLPPIPTTSRKLFQQSAAEFIASDKGVEALAAEIVRSAQECDSDRVIIDGIRQLSTFEAVKRLWNGKVYTLHVQTPPDLAFMSYQNREEKLPVRQFMQLYDAPIEQDIQAIARQADVIAYNWYGEDTYSDLSEQIMRLIAEGEGQ